MHVYVRQTAEPQGEMIVDGEPQSHARDDDDTEEETPPPQDTPKRNSGVGKRTGGQEGTPRNKAPRTDEDTILSDSNEITMSQAQSSMAVGNITRKGCSSMMFSDPLAHECQHTSDRELSNR